MAQQRTGGTGHAETLVVRDERRVADQVHRVEPVSAVQDPAHQLPADAEQSRRVREAGAFSPGVRRDPDPGGACVIVIMSGTRPKVVSGSL
jgi:hypothetical protein